MLPHLVFDFLLGHLQFLLELPSLIDVIDDRQDQQRDPDADADRINDVRAEHEDLHEGQLLHHHDLRNAAVNRGVADGSKQQNLEDVQGELGKSAGAARTVFQARAPDSAPRN